MSGITYVQGATKIISGATSGASPALSTTTGNTLIVDIVIAKQYANYSSIADTSSLTWTQSIAPFVTGTDGITFSEGRELYNCNITGNASHTVTVTLDASGHGVFSVEEISGLLTSGALDQVSHTSEGSTTNNATHTCASTSTTSQANQLWHGFGFDNIKNAFHTYTVGAGWTQGQKVNDAGASGIITGYQIVSSTGTPGFVYTDAGGSADYFAQATSTWNGLVGADAPPLFRRTSNPGVRAYGFGSVL